MCGCLWICKYVGAYEYVSIIQWSSVYIQNFIYNTGFVNRKVAVSMHRMKPWNLLYSLYNEMNEQEMKIKLMTAKTCTHTLRINNKKCTHEIAYRWSIIFCTRICAALSCWVSEWSEWSIDIQMKQARWKSFISLFPSFCIWNIYMRTKKNCRFWNYQFFSSFFVSDHNLSFPFEEVGESVFYIAIVDIKLTIRSSVTRLLLSLHYGIAYCCIQ